jgi:hypothetical protein
MQVFQEHDLSLPGVQGGTMTCIVLAVVLFLFDTRKHFMHFLLDICVFQARTRALWVHGPVAFYIQGT